MQKFQLTTPQAVRATQTHKKFYVSLLLSKTCVSSHKEKRELAPEFNLSKNLICPIHTDTASSSEKNINARSMKTKYCLPMLQ